MNIITRNLAPLTIAMAMLPAAVLSAELKVEPGADLFKQHCAQCHGADGRGDGEAVEFKNIDIPDLTTITKRNDGSFPLADIVRTIDDRAELERHGGGFMPAWGEVFSFDEDRGDALAHARILNLVLYLNSIQED